MSLINEALKRAEADKLRNSSPYFNNLTVLRPADDDDGPSPSLPPLATDRPRTRRIGLPGVLGLLMVVAGIAGIGFVWHRWRDQGGLTAATAATRPAEASATPAPEPEVATQPARQPVAPDGRTALAFARAMEKLRYYDPPERPVTSREPAAASRPAAGHTSGPTTRPASRKARKPAESRPSPAPPSPVARKAPPAPAAPDRSKFRLNAIMSGPEGNMALINGSLLREGQLVLGAKIVKIGRYHVEFELAGQRFTLRM